MAVNRRDNILHRKRLKIRWSVTAVFAVLAFVFLSSVCVAYAAGGASVYRLYNRHSGEHFYTLSANEKNNLTKLGWRYEGVAWSAPRSGDAVYRLYNPNNGGEHHYTTDANERAKLIAVGWRDEGVSFYSGGKTAIYRVYNKNAQANNHHFTVDQNESKTLVSRGWNDEGVAFYADAAATAEKVLDVARSQMGYREGAHNYSKYGVWFKAYWHNIVPENTYDFSHGDWCAMFVSWCMKEAGVTDDVFYKHSFTPTMVAVHQSRGQWRWPSEYVPRAGDIIYYDWDGDSVPNHVGIVERVSGGTVTTIEGNYDNRVKRRTIAYNHKTVLGYGAINY